MTAHLVGSDVAICCCGRVLRLGHRQGARDGQRQHRQLAAARVQRGPVHQIELSGGQHLQWYHLDNGWVRVKATVRLRPARDT